MPSKVRTMLIYINIIMVLRSFYRIRQHVMISHNFTTNNKLDDTLLVNSIDCTNKFQLLELL